MGTGEAKIKYQIDTYPEAIDDLSKLDFSVRERIDKKIN